MFNFNTNTHTNIRKRKYVLLFIHCTFGIQEQNNIIHSIWMCINKELRARSSCHHHLWPQKKNWNTHKIIEEAITLMSLSYLVKWVSFLSCSLAWVDIQFLPWHPHCNSQRHIEWLARSSLNDENNVMCHIFCFSFVFVRLYFASVWVFRKSAFLAILFIHLCTFTANRAPNVLFSMCTQFFSALANTGFNMCLWYACLAHSVVFISFCMSECALRFAHRHSFLLSGVFSIHFRKSI